MHEGDLYFPMVDRVQRNTDGTWIYNATIGQVEDSGKGKIFDILAVLADSNAQSTVQDWYAHHYDMKSLPVGMTTFSIVTVIRR